MVKKSWSDCLPLLLLSLGSRMFVKQNPDRNKIIIAIITYPSVDPVTIATFPSSFLLVELIHQLVCFNVDGNLNNNCILFENICWFWYLLIHLALLTSGLYHFQFKVGLSPSKKIYIISLIESSLKMMRIGFCFNLKTLFVLKIFKFLSQLYGHAGKKNEPVNYLRL